MNLNKEEGREDSGIKMMKMEKGIKKIVAINFLGLLI